MVLLNSADCVSIEVPQGLMPAQTPTPRRPRDWAEWIQELGWLAMLGIAGITTLRLLGLSPHDELVALLQFSTSLMVVAALLAITRLEAQFAASWDRTLVQRFWTLGGLVLVVGMLGLATGWPTTLELVVLAIGLTLEVVAPFVQRPVGPAGAPRSTT